ncbi:MAG: NAD(+) diphosphatase [Synergistaceae bacterium]|jgi:NAD+ diphosphatase|nr:NAD(+) diphosphatase [Synergistaceae bacterium]
MVQCFHKSGHNSDEIHNANYWRTIMEPCTAAGKWLLFQNDLLLVKSKNPLVLPATGDEHLFLELLSVTGTLPASRGGFPWGEYPGDGELPPVFETVGLRELWTLGGEKLFQAAGTAFQMMDWKRNNRFCPRCGTAMCLTDNDRAYGCPQCEYMSYPILSPAIIVAVTREDKLLLARSPHFPKGRYSVLAGFVEPGESLEETVEREIFEEVGIRVKDVTYFGSQPWPFPHSLMLGFTARWAEGELTPDGKEIEDAGWFTPETMPEIPPSISISRRLIENWLAGNK